MESRTKKYENWVPLAHLIDTNVFKSFMCIVMYICIYTHSGNLRFSPQVLQIFKIWSCVSELKYKMPKTTFENSSDSHKEKKVVTMWGDRC